MNNFSINLLSVSVAFSLLTGGAAQASPLTLQDLLQPGAYGHQRRRGVLRLLGLECFQHRRRPPGFRQ